MKSPIKVSLVSAVAFATGMMWSSIACATLLSDPSTIQPAPPLSIYSAGKVADGCAVPAVTASTPVFYIDPDRGSINNNGSLAQPWDTLANVMTHKQAQLKNGAILNLYGKPTGKNHGAVGISNMANAAFVIVRAAPGQTPLMTSLHAGGAQNFVFQGLKIQSLKSWALVDLAGQNIIFTGNTVSSADDVSAWLKTDWVANASRGITVDGRPDVVDAASPLVGGVAQSHHSTNCITLTNNTITHVKGAVGMNADHSLFDGNVIDDYADDAVDYGGNYLTLSNNKITNVNDIDDAMHDDGFQGFLPGGTGYNAATFSNVVIDHNTIIRQTNPNLPFSTTMQGIDNFDGGGYRDWYNLKVTNNFIVTNEWNCIVFGGIHNSLIDHNTCLADGVKTSAVNGGSGPAPVTAPGNVSQIALNDYNHFSQKSSNVTVTNNVATGIQSAASTDQSNTISHNLASAQVSLYKDGKPQWYSKPGAYGLGNIIDPTYAAHFISMTTVPTSHSGTMLVYNPQWKTGAPYMGMGGMGASLPNTVTPPVPGPTVGAYTGAITIHANARQQGTPKLTVSVDGKNVGSVIITQNVHDGTGGSGFYTINYSAATKPQKVDVTLDGYTSTEQKYVSVNVFNLDFTENSKKVTDLLRYSTGKIMSGHITFIKTNPEFFTNGSTLEFDVSKL